MTDKKMDILQRMAEDEAAEVGEFEAMKTVEVPSMDWQAWFQYQEDIVASAEEVTNG